MKVSSYLVILAVLSLSGPTLTEAEIDDLSAVPATATNHVSNTLVGACCLDGSCSVLTSYECEGVGGEYLGDFTTCYPGDVCDCCEGIRGNVDADPLDEINITDLTYLVIYLFLVDIPYCELEENVDGILYDGVIPVDVRDLTYLVAYLFTGGPAPPPCP